MSLSLANWGVFLASKPGKWRVDLGKNLRKYLRIMTKPPFYAQSPISPSFVGARAQRLANVLSEQGDAFFAIKCVVTPARCVSTVLHLHIAGPSSLMDIARALSEQHQLTAHRISQLEQMELISRKPDPNDKRRRTFHLTQKGQRDASLIEERCRAAVPIFEDINQHVGCDVSEVLDSVFHALSQHSLLEREEQLRSNGAYEAYGTITT